MSEKILLLKDVKSSVAKSRSQIYKEIKQGTFPRQIKLSKRRVGWIASEIEAHVEKLIQASRGEGG